MLLAGSLATLRMGRELCEEERDFQVAQRLSSSSLGLSSHLLALQIHRRLHFPVWLAACAGSASFPGKDCTPCAALTDPCAQLPSYVCSYGFSVTQVSFKEYFLATLFASAPMIFINVGLGAGAKNIQDAFSGKVTEILS